MDDEEVVKFWAYRHVNGKISVKRFTDQDAVEDAYDSNFVDSVLDPYPAKNRLEAEQIAVSRLAHQ